MYGTGYPTTSEIQLQYTFSKLNLERLVYCMITYPFVDADRGHASFDSGCPSFICTSVAGVSLFCTGEHASASVWDISTTCPYHIYWLAMC